MSQIFESLRMRVLTPKLRVKIENETRVFFESLNFEIKMRVSQKSAITWKTTNPEKEGTPPKDQIQQ